MWKCVNVKGVARSDEPTERCHVNLQLRSTLRSFITSVSSLFSWPAHNFNVLLHSHRSHNIIFGNSRQVFSEKKVEKPTVHLLLSSKQQTDTVSDLRSWRRPKTELKQSEYWTYVCQVAGNTTPNEW